MTDDKIVMWAEHVGIKTVPALDGDWYIASPEQLKSLVKLAWMAALEQPDESRYTTKRDTQTGLVVHTCKQCGERFRSEHSAALHKCKTK